MESKRKNARTLDMYVRLCEGKSINKKTEAVTLTDTYNEKLGVSNAQREAMVAGSMFGWHVPAADPSNYDGHGKLKVSANKDRENAR